MPDLDPPPITVTNPAGPPERFDVLLAGSERQLWQPSRRLVALVTAIVLIVAVVTVPTLLLVQHRHTQTTQRQELAQVRLHAVDDQTDGEGTSGVLFTVTNDGRQAVTVVSVHVDREGYPVQEVHTAIAPNGDAALVVQVLKTCPKPVPMGGPSGVVLRVRTRSGGEKSVRLGVRDSTFSDSYRDALQQACGEASNDGTEPGFTGTGDGSDSGVTVLDGTLGGLHRVGRTLHGTVTVQNTGASPIAVRLVSGEGGLHAAARFPITLPAAQGGSFPVVLSIESCPTAKASFPGALAGIVSPISLLVQGGGDTSFSEPTVDEEGDRALNAFVASLC